MNQNSIVFFSSLLFFVVVVVADVVDGSKRDEDGRKVRVIVSSLCKILQDTYV